MKPYHDLLPDQLSHIKEVIIDSEKILHLTEIDESFPERVSKETRQKAVDFLVSQAITIFSYGRIVLAPHINPTPHGCIDIHWDYPTFELLINIPQINTESAGYYGDDRKENKIEGSLLKYGDEYISNSKLSRWLFTYGCK